MLQAAASAAGCGYKQELMELMDVQPWAAARAQTGTDLPTLAGRVGVSGTVIGVDRDPAMLVEARRRTSDCPQSRSAKLTPTPSPSSPARWTGPGTTGFACMSPSRPACWHNYTWPRGQEHASDWRSRTGTLPQR